MKRQRRYREKSSHFQIGIASIHKERRIHDFLKGWGTLCKDGSILWDWWRPPTKRRQKWVEKHCKFDKWIFPIFTKIMPEWNVKDFVNIQPLTKE